jgi:tetratricopeptide (TPR) repeat protein
MTPRRSLGAGLTTLLLLTGAAALAAARWTRPVAEADAALARRDWDRACDAYARAESRFDRVPALRQLFADDYARVAGAQLWIAYHRERYDEVIDRAQRAPDGAAPHLWAGLAFLAKGRAEPKSDAQLGLLTRAEEELRRAVEEDPADWDTKYDFELVSRIAAGLRKQPKVPPNLLMQLLRQPPKSGARPGKRVG